MVRMGADIRARTYIREALADLLQFEMGEDCCISMMRLYKGAGRTSGLSSKSEEAFWSAYLVDVAWRCGSKMRSLDGLPSLVAV